MNKKIYYKILIVLIFGVAAFFRFWNLDNYPPGLYPDEAVNATDALRSLDSTTGFDLYYPNNNGREGLFINILAITFLFFGASLTVLRAVPAIIGFFTIISSYFLGKEIAGPKLGILFSFLMSVSFWHVNFSRIGFRAILVPLILILSFYLLIKAAKKLTENFTDYKLDVIDRKVGLKLLIFHYFYKYRIFFLAGLVYGIGFHTYIAYRISPLIITSFFFFLFLVSFIHKKNNFNSKLNKNGSTKNISYQFVKESFGFILRPGLMFIFGAFLTIAPIIFFYLSNPELVNARQNDISISILDKQNNQGNLISKLSETFTITLGQFVYRGDMNFRHNLPPQPQISPFVRIFFVSGLLICFICFILSFLKLIGFDEKLKRKKHAKIRILFYNSMILIKRPGRYIIILGTLIVWFFIMLSPAFLTVEGLPHSLRSIGSLPSAYLISAFCLYLILDIRLNKNTNKFLLFIQKVKNPLIYCGLIMTLIFTFINYFLIWGRIPQTALYFEKKLVNIGKYINSRNDDKIIYFIVDQKSKTIDTGFSVSLETVRFISWEKFYNVKPVKKNDIDSIKPKNSFIIILQSDDEEIKEEFKRKYGLTEKIINLSSKFPYNEFIVLE